MASPRASLFRLDLSRKHLTPQFFQMCFLIKNNSQGDYFFFKLLTVMGPNSEGPIFGTTASKVSLWRALLTKMLPFYSQRSYSKTAPPTSARSHHSCNKREYCSSEVPIIAAYRYNYLG